MRSKFVKYIIIFLISLICQKIIAQNSFSLKANTVTYQFTDTQPELTNLKLSSDGKIAVEPGIILAYETYATNNAALRLSQAVILDKASHLAGATSIMVKLKLAKSFKHSVYIALGPTFHFEKLG